MSVKRAWMLWVGVAIGGLLVIAPVATARVSKMFLEKRFAVNIRGIQLSDQKYHHVAQPGNPCDASVDSEGTEEIHFNLKPESADQLLAWFITKNGDPFLTRTYSIFGTEPSDYEMTGDVERTLDEKVTPNPGECSSGGGSSPSPPPDCGKRKLDTFNLLLEFKRKHTLGMEEYTHTGRPTLSEQLDDLYHNCGAGEGSLTLALGKADIHVTRAMLLGMRKRTTFTGKYSRVISDPETWNYVGIRYEITLTPLKPRK